VGRVAAPAAAGGGGSRATACPYVDGVALSLLAGALALGGWRLVLARRRRRLVGLDRQPHSPEQVLEGMR